MIVTVTDTLCSAACTIRMLAHPVYQCGSSFRLFACHCGNLRLSLCYVYPVSCFFLFRCYVQGRINHCAGCTMGGGPATRGPRSTAKFYHAVLTLGLNVKKGRQLFGGRKVHPRKKVAKRMRKGPPPYVGMGPPEWLIWPWSCGIIFYDMEMSSLHMHLFCAVCQLEAEVSRCRELRKHNLLTVINEVRGEIRQLWNLCCISHDERHEFTGQ